MTRLLLWHSLRIEYPHSSFFSRSFSKFVYHHRAYKVNENVFKKRANADKPKKLLLKKY